LREQIDKLVESRDKAIFALQKETQAEADLTLKIDEEAQKRTNQEKADQKTRAENVAKAADERKQKELDVMRAAQDAAFALIKDNQQRELKQLETQSNRQIADLQKRLTTEKNLTKVAKEAINQQILSLQEKQNIDIAEINKKYSDAEINRQIEIETELINLSLAAVKKGTQDELDLQSSKLDTEMQAEIKAMEEKIRLNENYYKELAEISAGKGSDSGEDTLTGEELMANEIANMKLAIETKYQQDKEKLQQDFDKKTSDRQALALQNEFNEKLQQLGENELLKAQFILENERALNAQLLEMDTAQKEALGYSQEQYEALVIASKQQNY